MACIFEGGTSEEAGRACGFGACKFADVYSACFVPQKGAADLWATASSADLRFWYYLLLWLCACVFGFVGFEIVDLCFYVCGLWVSDFVRVCMCLRASVFLCVSALVCSCVSRVRVLLLR